MTPLEVGDRAAADVTLWTRPHVGGLVDFEVISTDYSQRFWRHLEVRARTTSSERGTR